MRGHSILITEAILKVTPSERVYSWLEARALKGEQFENDVDDAVEQSLLDRRDPLIDLGLARFARCDKTVRALFS